MGAANRIGLCISTARVDFDDPIKSTIGAKYHFEQFGSVYAIGCPGAAIINRKRRGKSSQARPETGKGSGKASSGRAWI